MADDTRVQQVKDLMIDIRTATGDNRYGLGIDNDANLNPMLQLNRGMEHPISPRLTVEGMLMYLTAFDEGVHAGYLAAKRGK